MGAIIYTEQKYKKQRQQEIKTLPLCFFEHWKRNPLCFQET